MYSITIFDILLIYLSFIRNIYYKLLLYFNYFQYFIDYYIIIFNISLNLLLLFDNYFNIYAIKYKFRKKNTRIKEKIIKNKS